MAISHVEVQTLACGRANTNILLLVMDDRTGVLLAVANQPTTTGPPTATLTVSHPEVKERCRARGPIPALPAVVPVPLAHYFLLALGCLIRNERFMRFCL